MTEAIELDTGFDLETIRQAAEGPATGPLGMRLQAIIRQMLPAYEASLAHAGSYEPTADECQAFIDEVDRSRRYHVTRTEAEHVAAGLRAARKARP